MSIETRKRDVYCLYDDEDEQMITQLKKDFFALCYVAIKDKQTQVMAGFEWDMIDEIKELEENGYEREKALEIKKDIEGLYDEIKEAKKQQESRKLEAESRKQAQAEAEAEAKKKRRRKKK